MIFDADWRPPTECPQVKRKVDGVSISGRLWVTCWHNGEVDKAYVVEGHAEWREGCPLIFWAKRGLRLNEAVAWAPWCAPKPAEERT